MNTDVRIPPRANRILTSFLTALFILASSPLFLPSNISSAQAARIDNRIVRLKTDINRLLNKGFYVPALTKAKLYVRLTAKKYGTRHPNYARALQLQAKVYRRLKRPLEARKLDVRAVAILKNHRNFKVKQSVDIRAAKTAAKKREIQMKARMERERRQNRTAALKRKPQKRPGLRPAIKPRMKPVMKRRQAAPIRPTTTFKKRMRTTSPKAAPNRNAFNARKPTAARRGVNTSRPVTVPRSQMRTSRTTRAQPPVTARRRGAAPRRRTIAKSRAPAAPSPSTSRAAAPAARMAHPPAPVAAPPQADIGRSDGSVFDLDTRIAPPVAAPMKPSEPVPVAKDPKNHTIVKVYFATDRQRTNSTKLASIFGGQPSEPKRISYGICEVSIPKGHKPGALEAPSIWRFEFKEDPDKHVVLLKVHAQQKNSYFSNLKSVIDRSKGQNAFIFIHGYNVTFTDAARRTAQISYDLGFDGAPVFYSWPSTGELGGYPTDEENIAWAQQNVKQFLRDFVEKTDAQNIYLVAHSMGSRALTGAVASLMTEAPQFKKRFKEIILAAPDISARIFRDNIAPKMIEASNNITLYVSSDDKALAASRKFHANPRAGEAGKNIIIFNGIDTIDATGIDASLLAHSYFAEAKSIISDILSIFQGQRPSGRKTLKPVKTDRGVYWAFTK